VGAIASLPTDQSRLSKFLLHVMARVGECWIGGVGTAHVISLHPSTTLAVWGQWRRADRWTSKARQAQHSVIIIIVATSMQCLLFIVFLLQDRCCNAGMRSMFLQTPARAPALEIRQHLRICANTNMTIQRSGRRNGKKYVELCRTG
jgi:hypothetical protein